jgi:hypothetical protein
MYISAIDADADIVFCDYMVETKKESRHIVQIVPDDRMELISCLLSGKLQGFLWNKLIRRELYLRGQFFKPGVNYMEDLVCVLGLVYEAGMVNSVPNALVHYNRLNANSITSKVDDKRFSEIKSAIKEIENYLREKSLLPALNRELNILKLKQKAWSIHCNWGTVLPVVLESYEDSDEYVKFIDDSWYLKFILRRLVRRSFFSIKYFVVCKRLVDNLQPSFLLQRIKQ